MEVLGWQWPLIGALFMAYAVAGLVVGGICGWLLAAVQRDPVKDTHQVVAVLGISLAFAANLVPNWPLSGFEYLALAVDSVLIVLFMASLASDSWRSRTHFLASPWTVSLLLLGAPWMGREVLSNVSSASLRTVFSLLLLGLVAGGAVLSQRLLRPTRVTVLRQLTVAGAFMGAFVLLAQSSHWPPSAQAAK